MCVMKIISWNVNGVRAWHKKGSMEWVLREKPDFICLQEMKAREEQLPLDLREIPGYKLYMDHSKLKKGYSGVATYVREGFAPLLIDTELHVDNPSVLKSVLKEGNGSPSNGVDHEGRFIALHFNDFVLINCYFPNGGGDKERLHYKLNFYNSFLNYIVDCRERGKRVVFCGDVN
ncbi:MAG: hypothetical protein FGM57_03185, partial [Candidatus Taylorbacteria bacterium]|nr:hypothetical protein [Candidatus Taylorbacteria bacterium]